MNDNTDFNQPSDLQLIPLRVHSIYGIVDGLIRIPELIEYGKKHQVQALCITEPAHIFSAVRFYQGCLAAGIKPIIGVDLPMSIAGVNADLTLLAKDREGYQSLCRLITQYQKIKTPLPLEALAKEAGKLVGLTGAWGHAGKCFLHSDQNLRTESLKTLFSDLRDCLGEDAFLAIDRMGEAGEMEFIQTAATLATEIGLPITASHSAFFTHAQDAHAHDARAAISQGVALHDKRRVSPCSHEAYLKTPAQLDALFVHYPIWCANQASIIARCNLKIPMGEIFLPKFETGSVSPIAYLTEQAQKGLERKCPEQANTELYQARLKMECDCIDRMGFAGYFLIVMDFVGWAKDSNVPVGPGRGSGAGSLVAYALDITDLDPIEKGLLFERFLNPERVSMPDFDIDFCINGRDSVIDYVTERYGEAAVAQIITFGSMAAKVVVRDAARVLGYPYGLGDRLARLIPDTLGITLQAALKSEADLRSLVNSDKEVFEVFELALKLEGSIRNSGTHAGGVVIAPSALTDFVPLYYDENDHAVIQFDKDDCEKIGLIKFDFLGLKTLTIVHETLKMLNKTASDILQEDSKVYQMLATGETTGVFQLESAGMQEIIRKIQPKHMEHITALLALYRPGPLGSGMVDDFIARARGEKEIEVIHPNLTPILAQTYGVMIYQEQVMQSAQALAGYTFGEADLLRRAMGKKKPEIMAQESGRFVERAVALGVEKHDATRVFDLIEQFAGYGFNQSHSAAYALIAYQTAYLKTHHGVHFLCASMNADFQNMDRMGILITEAQRMKLRISPPCVNQSLPGFSVEDGAIRFGLAAIKGVGESVAEAIIQMRENVGTFETLVDFLLQAPSKVRNKRVLEALIFSGSLDKLGPSRGEMLGAIPSLLLFAQKENRVHTDQSSLFDSGLSPDDAPTIINFDYTSLTLDDQIAPQTLYLKEVLLLGASLNANWGDRLRSLVPGKTALIEMLDAKTVKEAPVVAWLLEIKKRMTAGRPRLSIQVFDGKQMQWLSFFDTDALVLEEAGLQRGDLGVFTFLAKFDRYLGRVNLKLLNVSALAPAIAAKTSYMEIVLPASLEAIKIVVQSLQALAEKAKKMPENHQIAVRLSLRQSKRSVRLNVPFKLVADSASLDALEVRGAGVIMHG